MSCADRSCRALRTQGDPGVTIAVVSPRSLRFRRWYVRRRRSRSRDRKTGRHSRAFRLRSSPHPDTTVTARRTRPRRKPRCAPSVHAAVGLFPGEPLDPLEWQARPHLARGRLNTDPRQPERPDRPCPDNSRSLLRTPSSTPSTPRAARLPCCSSAAASAPCRTGTTSSDASPRSTARCNSTRARGKSGTSADYSVGAAVDDIGRVIDATDIKRPILVGWSYGATIAVRYAAQHPEQVGGLVLIDGAYPITMFDEAGEEKVRKQFRRLGWMMRIMAALGRSARMSPGESANVVIEMDAVNGKLGPDFAALACPTVFVVGTGAHSGATEEEMRTVRAAVADAEASNERVSVFATTPHEHTQILNKAPDTVVAAIEDVIDRSR
ncbi:MAG TPA: alpha/beta fold hydrolase [Solirubrobacteraceae bacterium]|nr:alpha/beta fold hydrolase [Solirubrobacteraceae bacterium]